MFKRPDFDEDSKLTLGTLKLVIVLIIALVLCTSLQAKWEKTSPASDSSTAPELRSDSH
jgi:hypothetical protein